MKKGKAKTLNVFEWKTLKAEFRRELAVYGDYHVIALSPVEMNN